MDFFGEIVQINAIHKTFVEELCDFLSLDVNKLNMITIPAIELYFDLKHIDRYLFRTRPYSIPLNGCFIKNENDKIVPWESLSPPIPPYDSDAFKNKYLAFHAGAVSNNEKSYLIIGKRGSGKTTAVTRLVNQHNFNLLTDETAIISKNSLMVHSFPRMFHPRVKVNGKIEKTKIRADRVVKSIERNSKTLDMIFILKKSDIQRVTKLNSMNSCYHLLEGFQYAGTELKSSLSTITRLSFKSTYLIEYESGEFNSLINSIDKISDIIKKSINI